jgi:hypothetical protein
VGVLSLHLTNASIVIARSPNEAEGDVFRNLVAPTPQYFFVASSDIHIGAEKCAF